MVGAEGFEPTTSSSQSWRSTRLSYTPRAGTFVARQRRERSDILGGRAPSCVNARSREAGLRIVVYARTPYHIPSAATLRSMTMRSGNPALKESTFLDLGSGTGGAPRGDRP